MFILDGGMGGVTPGIGPQAKKVEGKPSRNVQTQQTKKNRWRY